MEFAEFLENLKGQKKTYKKPEREGVITKRTETARKNQILAVQANKRKNQKQAEEIQPEIQPEEPQENETINKMNYIIEYINQKQEKRARKSQIEELATQVKKRLNAEAITKPQEEEKLYSRHKYDAYIKELYK